MYERQVMTELSPEGINEVVPAKTPGIHATVLPDGRWLLYHRENNVAVTLNAPAGILWELCDGLTPVSGLVIQLAELYPDVSSDTLTDDTRQTVQQLHEQNLVTLHES